MDEANIPVIIAVGEYSERNGDPAHACEPVDLMAKALRGCAEDSGVDLLPAITSLNLIGLVSWQYKDPVTLLTERLGIAPAELKNESMGGETPVRLVHEAAIRIAAGEALVAAIVGGEATSSRTRARRDGATLPWTPAAAREQAVKFPSSSFAMSPVARALGVTDPAHIYPFYEVAVQAAQGTSPAQALKRNAELWSRYAKVAAQNPNAWIQTAPDAKTIAEVTADNRLIAWPYPKLMVANPSVNQAAAVIVTSLAMARKLGIAEEKILHIWGGAYASEPEDYLERDRYDHSTAQAAVLAEAVKIAGGDAAKFDRLELYSCFPVVPHMALDSLGLDQETSVPTVAGGLTFFGGPLNNYMSHAIAAMTQILRAHPGEIGLLYGQGGYVNKHQTLVVSTAPSPAPFKTGATAQTIADEARGDIPELALEYAGPAVLETYTVTYARDADPINGIVIARTPDGKRVMARVPASDSASIAILTSSDANAVGRGGHIWTDIFGKPVWSFTERQPAPAPRYCSVEREGPITIVTMNRPEVMNALHPAANAELAQIFDDFAADPDQWIAILTGAGDKAFSAGNDLKETARLMARGEQIETPLSGFAGITSRFDLDKPIIAAVNGIAMGGGFEIALACDLILAADNAQFALPEPRVGLAALAGGLHRLPREIGLKRAMGMILTGRRVDAAEGKALGFVHQIVPAAELMDAARQLAADILELSPMSLRASKQIVRLGLDEGPLSDAYQRQNSYPALKALLRSADAREGPRAFAQKRKPVWKGR